jgi:uncharacterized RDD family membrane protein YckC
MSQINCPHCGFVNFAISAYCGRCERPLRDPAVHNATTVVTVNPTSPPPTTGPIRSMPPPAKGPGTLPPSARPTAPLTQAPAPPPRPTGGSGPLLQRLTPRRTAQEPSAAQTSPDFATLEQEPGPTHAPTPVPMETDDTVIPTRIAGLGRLFGALLIDGALVLGVGAGFALLEMLVFDGHWPADRANFWESLAVWLHLYARTALRAFVVMAAFAVGYNAWGAQRGRTVGRAATGLWALRQSGAPIGWGFAVARGVVGLVSALVFGAGYFWIIVDPRHRSWADVASDAVVVAR